MHPVELAAVESLSLSSPSSQTTMKNLRQSLTSHTVAILSIVTNHSPTDMSMTKDLLQSLEILLVQWGCSSRLHSLKNYNTDEKYRTRDEVFQSRINSILKGHKRQGEWEEESDYLYKNGENGGKILSHNLIVTRVWMNYQYLQHQSAFTIPKHIQLFDNNANKYRATVKTIVMLCCHESISVTLILKLFLCEINIAITQPV